MAELLIPQGSILREPRLERESPFERLGPQTGFVFYPDSQSRGIPLLEKHRLVLVDNKDFGVSLSLENARDTIGFSRRTHEKDYHQYGIALDIKYRNLETEPIYRKVQRHWIINTTEKQGEFLTPTIKGIVNPEENENRVIPGLLTFKDTSYTDLLLPYGAHVEFKLQ